MDKFAVIDTETNYGNELISIGAVIADGKTMCPIDSNYYVITPECLRMSMYGYALYPKGVTVSKKSRRKDVIDELKSFLSKHNVKNVFAYNAAFDRNALPELSAFMWYDIMKIAAYRQYNDRIPRDAECCQTGKLKRNYGVEPMLRLLSGNYGYSETHNALIDALDELKIMQLLCLDPDRYIKL